MLIERVRRICDVGHKLAATSVPGGARWSFEEAARFASNCNRSANPLRFRELSPFTAGGVPFTDDLLRSAGLCVSDCDTVRQSATSVSGM